jgi:(2Fe-2S) ferredoxin
MAFRTYLMVCAGTGCVANQSMKVKSKLEAEINKQGLQDEVAVVATGCNGFCALGPIMVVQPDGIFYQLLKETDIPYLVEEHLLKGRIVKELLYTPPKEKTPVPRMSEIPFFADQTLIVLRNRGLINPESIDEAIARGAYEALAKVLTTMTPEEVIREIKASGLRGRGGGGFPTGIKWETCRHAPGDPKYIICNADEGDPGAFMDRSTIESDPHAVIEGMLIGAYAVGSTHGYVYIRNEYPIALERLKTALDQARAYELRFRHTGCPRRRSICLRGIDGTDGLHRREARRAPGKIRAYRREGRLGQTLVPEQCGNLGQCSADHPERGSVVCRHRHRRRLHGCLGRKQGDEGVFPFRQSQ